MPSRSTSVYRRFIITVTVILCSMIQLIDTSIVNVAVPHIMGNLGANTSQASWVVTAYVFANVIIIPITGWLSEFFGRKKYYLISIGLFVIASVFCGQATNIWELVIFRFIQGLGGGGLLPTSRVILIENYPPEDLSLAMALFGMGVVIGPTIGPTLGGWLTTTYSWRWIFYVNVPVGIIAFMMAFINVEEVGAKLTKARSIDGWGLFFLFMGFGALEIILEQGERDNWFASNFIVWLTAISIIGILAFIVQELTTDNPVVDLYVLRHRNLAVGTFFGFIMGFGLYASVFVFPLFLENLLDYSALQTGLILIPSALTAALMMPVASFLMRKGASARLLAAIGFGLFFVFSWLMSHQSLQSGASDFYLPLVLRGMGLGCLSVPINTIAMWGLEGHELNEGSGFSSLSRSLGGSIGIALVSTFLDQRNALHWTRLVSNITRFDYTARSRINEIVHFFKSSGFSSSVAQSQAYQAIAGTVTKQAYMMTYNDIFLAVGVLFVICIPLLLLTTSADISNEDTEVQMQAE
ncbi:MAG TPA: DHA2 family efflux MFS transporter permease subunit [Balneolaceae bacterium]|nr:DHA2 family efflux MFS transporter permease subunit [Balneolaceae bacterium]